MRPQTLRVLMLGETDLGNGDERPATGENRDDSGQNIEGDATESRASDAVPLSQSTVFCRVVCTRVYRVDFRTCFFSSRFKVVRLALGSEKGGSH